MKKKKAVINLGNIKITELNYQILQKFFMLRKDCGKAINIDIKQALRRIIIYAIRCGYINTNPLEYVKVVGVERQIEKKAITVEEYHRILKELEERKTFEHDAIAIAVKIGFYTGLRLSEVCALHKDDFDFTTNEVYVHRKLNYKGLKKGEIQAVEQMKSKSSKAKLPIAEVLKKELITWFAINPYQKVICDSDGNYVNCDSMGHTLRKIAEKLNIKFHFHLLRHTYTSMLINAKVDIKVAQELLRHANFNTTMSVYAHIPENKKVEAVNSVFGGFLVSS